MDNLPVETLAFILKLSIRDYFNKHRDPCEYPPIVLHVCRKWREIAINTPGCWTSLMFKIDTRSKCAYGQRNLHHRKTKGKASQDVMGNYFKWAKNVPISLSLTYHIPSREASQNCQKNLAPWLVKNLPKLRSFSQVQGRYSGSDRIGDAMSEIWIQLPLNCLTHLTQLHVHLEFGPPFYPANNVITAPNLLIAILENRSWILKLIEAPKLNYLDVCQWEPQDAHLLAKYPLLRNLGVRSLRHSFPEIQCKGIRYLIFRRDYSTCHWYIGVVDTNADEAFTQFLINARFVFPNVLCWHMDAVTALGLVEGVLAPGVDFSFLTTLTIMVDNDNGRRLPYSDVKQRFAPFWERFSCLKHLTLGGAWLGGLERDIYIELNWSYGCEVPDHFLVQLIYYLGSISQLDSENLSSTILPSLEDLVFQDFALHSHLLTALRKFLESRSRSNVNSRETGRAECGESQGCKVTFRRCRLHESERGPARFVATEEWTEPPVLQPEH